jgi:hypothetical protein
MKILAITPNGKHDYLASSILEGLKKYDIELYCTGAGNGDINHIPDEQFKEHYKTCDYIFAIWGKSIYNNVTPPNYYLIDEVNGWGKTVYIDGSEYNYTGFNGKTDIQLDPTFLAKSKYYFKRECLREHMARGVLPLPFCTVDADFKNLPKVDKDIDVLCAFGQTGTGQRKAAIQASEELKLEGYNIVNSAVSNYDECMNRSWITIDAFGGGECNARAFQVMANHSLLFMEKYNIVIPNLTDTEHYVSWDNGEDLKNKIRTYLDNRKKLGILTNNSYTNIIEHHTSKKRVEYIFNHIMK